jgi:hypothetical protein
VVHLVKVDVVGLEPFQTAFAVLADLVRRKAAAVRVGLGQVGLAFDGIEDLGGQDHRVPAAASLGKPASQDLLGVALLAAPAVDVGGVEEIDAKLQGPIHDLETLFLGGVPAEVHGAQTDVAHQDPVFSQTFVFDCHVRVPLLLRLRLRVNSTRMFQKSQAGASWLRIKRVAAISMSVSEVCTLYS